MRTQATIRNALWGILQQAVLCVLGLLSRRVMLQTIGVSGVGLNGLLTNVLSLLSLTEMGVGSVIIYHMYTPLANGDWEEICRLMRFYRNVYRGIALVMTGAGLLLVPFLPYLVNGVHYSQSYVTAVFLLFLAQTASSYLFSYKRSLLSADQKQYVICSTIPHMTAAGFQNTYAHNQWIQTLFDQGLIGLFLYAALMGACFFRNLRRNPLFSCGLVAVWGFSLSLSLYTHKQYLNVFMMCAMSFAPPEETDCQQTGASLPQRSPPLDGEVLRREEED